MATRKSKKVKKKVGKKKGVTTRVKKKKVIKTKISTPPKKKLEETIRKTEPDMKPKIEKPKEEKKVPPISESGADQKKEIFKKILLDMREKLLAEKSETRLAESLTPSTEIGDLIDLAGDERERELSLLLTRREKEKLLAINEALQKIAEGTYGICEECGENIGEGRLKAMPLAKLCVNCQAKLEEELSIQKKTEEDLTYRGLAFATGLEEEES